MRSAWSEPAPGSTIEVDRPSLTFSDVGGMESVKEEIRIKIIHPMNHPELYQAYGKSIGGGILLYGPPGCGKTYLARATAGEIHAGFLAVGINDVLEMWIGNSERNLHALFEQARQNTPCVLFFDEVDALAASRADLRASGGRQLINQFLAELDGIDSRNEGVLILAATNAPWHLDPAFRRPGPVRPHPLRPASRLAQARAAILRLLCRGKPVQNIDYEHLAKKTDHFSGADLRAVVDLAVEAKLREAMKAGVPKPLDHQGPGHGGRGRQAVDPRVVRDGPQLCPLFQPGRDLRRYPQTPETRMSTAFQRGIVLFNQNRYDLADREFRQELAESPDNAQRARLPRALPGPARPERRSPARGRRGDPPRSRARRSATTCGASSSADQERLKEAEAAAQEAIRLDPDNANYLGLLASIEMGRRRWAAALEAADRGLALDPEHAQCTNLRAMALVQLGRKDEARETLGSALANDPENALTHANQGWALLHRGDHQQALEHFREALRIDPELDWARAGIVEALKARHLIYRLMLRFFLWIGRQARVAQWVIILGFVFGPRILARIARANPALEPFIFPVIVLIFAFVMLTWIASPLFNFLLRFNRFGRLALSRDQRVASSWIGGCFLLAVVCFVAYLVRIPQRWRSSA